MVTRTATLLAIASAIIWVAVNVPLLDFALGGMLLGLLPEAIAIRIDTALDPVASMQSGLLDRIYGYPFMGIHSSGSILQFIAMQAALIGVAVFAVSWCTGVWFKRFPE